MEPPVTDASPPQPGILKTYAILTLIDGILNVLLGIMAGGFLFCLTIFCAPLALYPMVLGVLEIVQFTSLNQHPPVRRELPNWLSIMQIVGIAFSNPLALACGIIGFIANGDESVKAYLRRPVPPPPPPGTTPPTAPPPDL